jgi:hypothetical protein
MGGRGRGSGSPPRPCRPIGSRAEPIPSHRRPSRAARWLARREYSCATTSNADKPSGTASHPGATRSAIRLNQASTRPTTNTRSRASAIRRSRPTWRVSVRRRASSRRAYSARTFSRAVDRDGSERGVTAPSPPACGLARCRRRDSKTSRSIAALRRWPGRSDRPRTSQEGNGRGRASQEPGPDHDPPTARMTWSIAEILPTGMVGKARKRGVPGKIDTPLKCRKRNSR